MKSCDEMVSSLFARREQYAAQQKKKRKMFRGAAISVGCVCFVALLTIGMWQNGMLNANTPGSPTGDDVHAAGNEYDPNDVMCGEYWEIGGDNADVQSGEENFATINFDDINGENAYGSTDSNDPCDILGMVVVDGATYIQFTTDAHAYTVDACLGAASDFEGTYKTHLYDIAGKLYTTKEDADVLLVKLINGGIVTLKKTK